MTPISRIAFFGTPAFAVPVLDALAAADRSPDLVVCQPSRVSGRGRKLRHPPVAQWALDHQIELWQPERVKRKSFVEPFAELEVDIAIVVAFGQIFPQALLDLPRLGCVNLHASILPRHRGAAPIAAAIAAGDETTGVCSMVMEAGLDTGPVLLCDETAIGERETTAELTPRLAVLGGEVIVKTLDRLEAGDLEPTPQDDERATYAPRLDKADGILDWSVSALAIDRLRRAFDPWPGVSTFFRDNPLKVLDCEPGQDLAEGSSAKPGELIGVDDGALLVACGENTTLRVLSVQRSGKRAVSARDFVNGEQPRLARKSDDPERFAGPPQAEQGEGDPAS